MRAVQAGAKGPRVDRGVDATGQGRSSSIWPKTARSLPSFRASPSVSRSGQTPARHERRGHPEGLRGSGRVIERYG